MKCTVIFIQELLLILGFAIFCEAHTTFTNFFINGVDQGDGTAIRMSNVLSQSTSPISNIENPYMACGM